MRPESANEKKDLEKAISELPKNTFNGVEKCFVKISKLRTGDVVKIRIPYENVPEHVRVPIEATNLNAERDCLQFSYRNRTYFILYNKF